MICAALLSGCANGAWSRADTYRQAAVIGVGAVDWLQTREIAKNPEKYYEMNPILGSHPSTKEVDAYFAACALAHTGVAMALPPKWREPWQYLWIGLEAATVAHNYNIGIKIDF
jgi:hypothetical protein